MKTMHLGLAAGTVGLLFTTAAFDARGQGAAPTPSCGLLITDKAKDNEQPTTDITGVWYDHAGGKTFANVSVADLKLEFAMDTTFFRWDVAYAIEGDKSYRLIAHVRKDGAKTFTVREIVTAQGQTTSVPAGSTTGEIFEGPGGVVRWEIPANRGGEAGKKLANTVAASDEIIAGNPDGGYLRKTTSIDDTSTAKPAVYTVGPCTAPPPAATPEPTPGQQEPSQSPTPAPPPASGGGATSPGGTQARLDVTVSKRVPAARKVRRSLAITLSSAKGVTQLEGALLTKGAKPRVVARGKLASLKGKGRLKLRVARKLKKSSYSLFLSGRNADGNAATQTVALKFR